MAPETVSHAVVLDIRETAHQRWQCLVDRWDPRDGGGLLRVSWNADMLPTSPYSPAAGGVVYVAAPPGYERSQYSATPRLSADPLRISWTEGLGFDSLVLVALLPRGYAFESMAEGQGPDEAKIFDERMALLWPVELQGRTRFSWVLMPFAIEEGPRLRGVINDARPEGRFAPPELGEVPTTLLEAWAAAQPGIVSAVPPEANQQMDWHLSAGHDSETP